MTMMGSSAASNRVNDGENESSISDECEDDDDDDEYRDLVQSVRSKTGLEVGIRVTWPFPPPLLLKQEDHHNIMELNLSTCLPPTEMAPMFDGTQWAGTRVWRAAIVTLQYLLCNPNKDKTSPLHEIIAAKQQQQQQNPHQQKLPMRRINILELGCGLGVPGMILQKCLDRYCNYIDCRVVLTDKSSLVQQLRLNIATNFSSNDDDDDDATQEGDKKIQAHELDWSNGKSIQNLIRQTTTSQSSVMNDHHEDHDHDDIAKLSTATGDGRRENAAEATATTDSDADGFDLVFNCDCIYEHLYGNESWQALLQCQEVLLQHKPDTICITAVERRNGDGVDSYLQACAASPYIARVERIDLGTSCPPRQQQDVDDSDGEFHEYNSYWAKHPPAPEVEIYRAHGHAS